MFEWSRAHRSLFVWATIGIWIGCWQPLLLSAASPVKRTNAVVAASLQENLPPPVPEIILHPLAPPPVADDCDFLPTRVIIVADFTASMMMHSPAGMETRFSIAQWAVYDLLDAIPDGMEAAVISMRREPTCLQTLEVLTAERKSRLRRDVICTQPDGACELAGGLELVLSTLHKCPKPDARTCLIVITDGDDCQPAAAVHLMSSISQDFHPHVSVLGICAHENSAQQLKILAATGQGEAAFADLSKQLPSMLRRPVARLEAARLAHQQQFEHCQVELPQCLTEKAGLEAANACLAAEVTCLKDKLCQTQLKLEESCAEVAVLTADLEDAARHIDRLRDYLRWLWAALAIAWSALLALALIAVYQRCRIRIQRARLEALEAELAAVRCDLERTRNDLQHKECELRKLRDEVCCLQGTIRELEAELAAVRCDLERAKNDLQHKECELRKLRDEVCCQQGTIRELEAELGCCRDKAGDDADRICCLKKELESCQKCSNECREELCCAQRKLAGASTTAKCLQEQVKQLQCENFQLSTRLCEVEKCRAAMEERAYGATREMAANKKDCCGCGPVIAPTVTTPSTPSSTPTSTSTTAQSTPSTCCPGAPPAIASHNAPTPHSAIGTTAAAAPAVGNGGPGGQAGPSGSPGTAGAPNAGATSTGTSASAADAAADAEATATSF